MEQTNPFAMLQGAQVEAPEDEDFTTVESFVEYCLRVNVKTFKPGDAQRIARSTGRTLKDIMDELKSYGLLVGTNARRDVRGFNANDHNRWDGNECKGGSGWEVIAGFAGRVG